MSSLVYLLVWSHLIFHTFLRVTDVSRTITFPDRRFPDTMFPGKTFPGRLCLIDYFPYKTFPGQSLSRTDVSRTDVSRTICINNLEYFGMFMLQGKRWVVLCTVHVWLHAADYFLSLHNYFSFIIVSVYVAFIFYLIITKFTLYPLLDYALYRILTAGLQAHISKRSVYLHIVWLGL